MSAWTHANHILNALRGEEILVCDTVKATNMSSGGTITYSPGDRLRVWHSSVRLLWCFDKDNNRVTFDRQEVLCLERSTPSKAPAGATRE